MTVSGMPRAVMYALTESARRRNIRLEWIRRQQPSIDVKDLDEEKLNRLTDEYRALFRNPGTLPPLYYQLDKQQAELRVQKLALLISEVKAGEVSVTTQPAQ